MGDTENKPADGEQATGEIDEMAELAEALEATLDQVDEAQEGEEAPVDPLELLSAENAELKDKALRLAADMENLRRRTEREKAEATLYAASNFARDMLAVSDNMDRALGAVSQDQRDAADAVTTNLLEGVEMVQREIMKTFERYGIRRVDPLHEKFDPNVHQAMFEVPDPDQEAGTVVQVVQPGYVIGERVLRPAMVGVAKGGARPKETGETPEPDTETG